MIASCHSLKIIKVSQQPQALYMNALCPSIVCREDGKQRLTVQRLSSPQASPNLAK
jgi:hypothetical protein